ncbi:MAG TPA: glycine cleavage T C-terminal barrel domain-containing protein [Pyrinomonadaceae bacterium]|nr:glycine cleavage T C-terminal barrel domain-containing protein [Pyrinomonadaceae bacterium]
MKSSDRLHYNHIHTGGTAFHRQPRGLIAVHGTEAVQFLDGMITNDVKTMEDGAQMLAAFPDAKGRLIAVCRVTRQNDRFMLETEDASRQKIFDTLHRFTMAGDFFVEDLSETYRFIRVFDRSFIPITPPFIEFDMKYGTDYFVHEEDASDFVVELKYLEAAELSDELFDVLRIERGMPSYGIDMDETTIVPELGLDGLISYEKGCYIGQEIIARIHFRGHVAKRLSGLIVTDGSDELTKGAELTSPDGKSAGRITSVTISPAVEKTIALGFVRYDFLADGTKLQAGAHQLEVKSLPFV